MIDTDERTSTEWETLVEVGNYPSLALAQEHALVILAMRLPCWVSAQGETGGFALHAEAAAADAAMRELGEYENEREAPRPAPAVPREIFRHPAGWGVYGIWALALGVVFLLQKSHPWITERASSSSIGLLGRHEWWRPLSALFLHGDVPHLLGNLLSGLLFGSLVARLVGPWRGWALILACGAAGNALTSLLVWPEGFVSIGASTAVFGALGILSGLGFHSMLRERLALPWARIAAPVLAGIVILGLLGGGAPGGGTDVLGHVCGFGSGVAAGLAAGALHLAGEPVATGGA